MAAPDLATAARQCYSHMFTYWTAGTLDARYQAFWTDLIAVFPTQLGDATQPERTVANWIVPGVALINAGTLQSSSARFNSAVDLVYRVLLAANNAKPPTNPARITTPQATAILAAYNAHLD